MTLAWFSQQQCFHESQMLNYYKKNAFFLSRFPLRENLILQIENMVENNESTWTYAQFRKGTLPNSIDLWHFKDTIIFNI